MKEYPIVAIRHLETDEIVYCWGIRDGMQTVRACLSAHPDEAIEISRTTMTKREFDSLPEYEGEC